jgi:hypothetical protein
VKNQIYWHAAHAREHIGAQQHDGNSLQQMRDEKSRKTSQYENASRLTEFLIN